MASRFRYKRRVEFAETDLAGIAHFTNYLRYMEETEHAFFRSLGCSVHTARGDGGAISWPRLDVQCKFEKPLRFEDEIEIELIVVQRKSKTLKYHFNFYLRTGGGEQLIAAGNMTVVCAWLNRETGEMKSVEIPREFDPITVDAEYRRE